MMPSPANENFLKREHSFLPEPAGLFGLVIFWALFLLSGRKSLLCADTLWHIKVGQIILSKGHILTHDIFSHTVANKPWTAHEWLAEVFMAFIYNLGGFAGLSLVFFLMASATMALLFKISQKASNEWAALISTSTAAAFAQTHLLVRPHIFTWLLGAICLALLLKQSRWLWLLPFITALWSNLHGGVLLSLVLQGAFLCGTFIDILNDKPSVGGKHYRAKGRRQFLVLAASLIAIGCNPFGYSLLWFPFQVSADIFSQNITEWKAPDLQEMWYLRAWLLALFVLFAVHARKTTWAWRILIIFLLSQAFAHVRHVSIAALFLAPWTAMAGEDLFRQLRPRKAIHKNDLSLSPVSGPVLTAISFLVLFSISVMQPGWWAEFAEERFALSESYPQGALKYLQENGYPGEHLLNEYSWGGFLIFSLDNPPKVFIDGRADMYGEEVFTDYAKLVQVQPGMEEILKKYRIDWILFPKNSLLVRYLSNKEDWHEVYSDDHAEILTLQGSGTN